MDLEDEVDRVVTRADLAEFVRRLAAEAASPESQTWENDTLPRFLDALAAWVSDMNGYFHNQGLDVPEQPDWALVSRMLFAATMYE